MFSADTTEDEGDLKKLSQYLASELVKKDDYITQLEKRCHTLELECKNFKNMLDEEYGDVEWEI